MRIGRFYVAPELLTEGDLDGLVRIFADCALVPIKIEEAKIPYLSRFLEYTCYSPLFHDVQLKGNDRPPLYIITIYSEHRAGINFVSRAQVDLAGSEWWRP